MGLLAVKLSNALKRSSVHCNMTVTTHLKNIIVNGEKRGCSGFISCNGFYVYVNTEKMFSDKVMYRTASDTSDFTGGVNRFCCERDLASNVLCLLADLSNGK